MLICHVLAPAEVGGLERVVQALAVGHTRLGHQVHVAAVLDRDDAPHPFVEPLKCAGITVHELAPPPRRYLQERRRIKGLFRRLHPDIVHTHGYRCDVVDSGAARRLGIATVTTVHGFTGGGPKNRLYEWLQRKAYRRFDAVVAVSRAQVKLIKRAGVPASKIHLLRNAWLGMEEPLDRSVARERLKLDGSRFQIGWVGRVSREKGLDVMLAALPHLADIPLTLTVFGDGSERARLQARTAGSDLASRVNWAGVVPDAASLLGAFDALVLSSRTEGTPMVLFEAMAAGVPIVASRVGGVPDMVTETEARLVPPEDPAALATAVRALKEEPEPTQRRVEAARRRLAVEFTPDPWLAQYEALYRSIRRSPAD
jgi:glycosyltransferase involved in cell wall biosynthesis